ncbi:MAG: MOP flippase family protein [Actinomycetota bacterium]|nr:MOP flippase family protein [Actinomycetota bacterium]
MTTLQAQAVDGVQWTATSTLAVTAAKYIRTIILARLLVPDDFGLMAMLTVLIGLGQAFSDMGISLSIIWKQDASDDELSSIYWFNILTGIIVTGLVIAAAPLVVFFYHEPRLYDLVLWISPIFLVSSTGMPFQMMLQKELLFSRLAKIEIIATVVGAIVAVSAALMDGGVYALVWGSVVDIIVRAALLVVVGWKNWHPHVHFRWKDLRGFIRFGLFNMGERLLNFYYANIDYIILGRFLGGEILGIYMIAYQMVVEPFLKINPILVRVAFPVFAKKQEDNAVLRKGYYELSKVVALLTFPVLALIAATTHIFIPALFGEKWNQAIPLIQILVILGVLRALINPIGSILYAKGRTDMGFYWNLYGAVVNTVVFWIFVSYGVFVIAWLENGLTFISFILALWILNRVIGLKPAEYLATLARPLIANAIVAAATYAASLLLEEIVANGIALFAVLVVFGLSLYAAFLAIFERDLFKEYWRLLWRR